MDLSDVTDKAKDYAKSAKDWVSDTASNVTAAKPVDTTLQYAS